MLPEPVERVSREYLDRADRARPGLIEGLYIVGSSALGDYCPAVSDADFIAVTARPAGPEDEAALVGIHREIRAVPGLPSFEGVYVTVDDLRRSPVTAPPGLEAANGELTTSSDGRTPVEWLTLARHGIPVRGPAPADLGIHTDPDEVVGWTLAHLDRYWEPWWVRGREPDTWTAQALLTDWGVAWTVLGVSRLQHTVATGDICSKSAAGRWAQRAYSPHWHPIIREALRCRPLPLATPDDLDAAARRREEACAYLEVAITATRRIAPARRPPPVPPAT